MPLARYRRLGYGEDQEAAGFGIRMAQGSRPQRIEADLVYFCDERRSSDDGEALGLVECKTVVKDLAAAARQVRSYALWLLPAYYVITDAQTVSVWDFQGARQPVTPPKGKSSGRLTPIPNGTSTGAPVKVLRSSR